MKKIKLIITFFIAIIIFAFTLNVAASTNLRKGFRLDTVIDFGDYKLVVIKNDFNEDENLFYGYVNSCKLEVSNGFIENRVVQLDSNNICKFGIKSLICLVKFEGEVTDINLTDIREIGPNNLLVDHEGLDYDVNLDNYKKLDGIYVSFILIGLIFSICLFFIKKYSYTKFLDFMLYLDTILLLISLGLFSIDFFQLNVKLISKELSFILVVSFAITYVILLKRRNKKRKKYLDKNRNRFKNNFSDLNYNSNEVENILYQENRI